MNYYKRFAEGNNLRRIRKDRGMSQLNLAFYCNQSSSKISQYENGKIMPRYDVMRKIARTLDVEVDEIYPKLSELDKEVDTVKYRISGEYF